MKASHLRHVRVRAVLTARDGVLGSQLLGDRTNVSGGETATDHSEKKLARFLKALIN